MDHFTIILPCNQKDKLSNYTTKLPVNISLSGTWEVGVTEVLFTNSLNNFLTTECVDLLTFDQKMFKNIKLHHKNKAVVEKGLYNTETIVQKINEAISKHYVFRRSTTFYPDTYLKGVERPQGAVNVNPIAVFDKEKNEVTLRPGVFDNNELIMIRPGIKLCSALGIDYDNIMIYTRDLFEEYSKFYAKHPDEKVSKENVAFTSNNCQMDNITSFNISSDICQNRIFGSSVKSLLRVVRLPKKMTYGERYDITYTNPEYIRLKKIEFDEINIQIKETVLNDEYEESFIPFQFGQVMVTLDFRKIAEYELESQFTPPDVTTYVTVNKKNPLDVDHNPDDVEYIAPKHDT